MTVETTVLLKEVSVLPELFLGISIIYFVVHGTFVSMNKTYPLIYNSILYLSVLTLFMTYFLILNENLTFVESSTFNNSIVNDYLSFFSKQTILIFSGFSFIIIRQYLTDQKINNFEYILLFLFSILGLLLLCSANDLITAYLAIELQSLAFYVLAAFKKNSTFSVEAGLKYFILGSFSSSLFLFGSSLIYGITGSINFEDFKDLFFWVFPGSIGNLSDLNQYYLIQDQKILLDSIINRVSNSFNNFLLTNDFNVIFSEFYNIEEKVNNENLFYDYSLLHSALTKNLQNSICYPFNYDFYTNFLETNHNIYPLNVLMQNTLSTLVYENCVLNTSSFESVANFVIDFNVCISSIQFASILEKLDYIIWLNECQNNINFFKPFDFVLLQFALIFLLISLFFKLALAPFHLWLPDVYEGSPSSTTFFFAVVPKLSIFILLIRIFYYSFYGFIDNWRYFIVLIAIISIVVGSFVGLEQRKLKSLLAYSAISHMGYSLIAFNTGTIEGIQMLFYYLLIYMASGLCIWSIFVFTRLKFNYLNKQNKDLTDLVLLHKSNKMLALFFSIVLLSIAGLPPMIGFFAKIGIFLVSIEAYMFFVAFLSILCSVISTFFYVRIIKIIYFEKVLVGKLYYPITTQKSILVAFLFYSFIFLFVNPTLLYLFSYKISLLSMITTFC